MKFIMSLAMKNLTRYKRRTIITAISIAVGLMMFIVVDSLLMGAEQESMRNLRWYETSSIKIFTTSYWEDRYMLPLDAHIQDPYELVTLLQSHGIVATPRMVFSADMILYSEDFGEDGNMLVQVTAVDTQKDNTVFRLEESLIAGRFPESGKNEMVIGSWFAEDIGAEIGYWVTLVTRGLGGFYEAMDMEIVGIVNCPNPNVNRTLLLVPLDTASEYLGMSQSATEIGIRLPDSATISRELEIIQRLIDPTKGQLIAVGWETLAQDYIALAEAKRGGTGILLFLVFIIAAVGISNTMLMAIYERIRELGMMRSLGMSDWQIRMMFLFEAGGIGLLGSIAGTILGILANFYLVNVGFDFSFIMRDLDMGYRIQSILRGAWSLYTIVGAFFLGSILSVIVAWFPTRKALKMDIPSCLRYR